MKDIMHNITGIWHGSVIHGTGRFWFGVVLEHSYVDMRGVWYLITPNGHQGLSDTLYIAKAGMQVSTHMPRGAP